MAGQVAHLTVPLSLLVLVAAIAAWGNICTALILTPPGRGSLCRGRVGYTPPTHLIMILRCDCLLVPGDVAGAPSHMARFSLSFFGFYVCCSAPPAQSLLACSLFVLLRALFAIDLFFLLWFSADCPATAFHGNFIYFFFFFFFVRVRIANKITGIFYLFRRVESMRKINKILF